MLQINIIKYMHCMKSDEDSDDESKMPTVYSKNNDIQIYRDYREIIKFT